MAETLIFSLTLSDSLLSKRLRWVTIKLIKRVSQLLAHKNDPLRFTPLKLNHHKASKRVPFFINFPSRG